MHEEGLETQGQLNDAVSSDGLPAVVLNAETVRADARAAMAGFWDALGLAWREEAFDWGRAPDDWSGVRAWHEAASTSTGIESVDAEEMLRVEFAFEAAGTGGASQLPEYLDYHWPYYDKLSQAALTL